MRPPTYFGQGTAMQMIFPMHFSEQAPKADPQDPAWLNS